MTTGSFGIDPLTGQFTVKYGSRTVATTDGTLVCLVSGLVDLTAVSVTFPDPQYKDYAYVYRYSQTRNILATPDAFIQNQTAQIFFGRRPEEYVAQQVLVAAPDGADIFVGQVRISRTTDPSHTWLGKALNVLPKQSAWMPWTGSALMEANLGFSRAMHIFIDGGNLVLERQMSVSTPAGGYGSFGDTIGSPAGNVDGSEVLYNVGPCVPAWTSTSSPYKKTDSRASATDLPTGPSDFETQRRGGPDQCTLTDPTDFTSVYSVDIRGHFGRRS